MELFKIVVRPVVGNKYHLSWSNNKFMTWTLVCIYSDGTCKVKSSTKAFNVKLSELREKPNVKVVSNNQLALDFQ